MAEQPKQPDTAEVDELVDVIEQLMTSGSGHLVVSDEGAKDGLRVDTYRSMDCSIGNQACCQPTELMDDEI